MRPHRTRLRTRERAVDPRPLLLLVGVILMILSMFLGPHEAPGVTLDLTTREMAELSHRVLTARVVSTSTRPDTREGIVTDVILRPMHTLKGPCADTITLALPGGTLGALTLEISEIPEFTPGEQVVVFLGSDGRPISGQRGKLSVHDGIIEPTGRPLALLESEIRDVRMPSADVLAESLTVRSESSEETSGATAQDVVALAIPAVTTVSPPSAAAGIGTVITITGSGFGTQGGSSAVEFYYLGSTPIVASGANIHSWSDTRIEVEVPVGIVDNYPASAASGPLTVVTATGSRSSGHAFTVTFGYGGLRWDDPAQGFYVQENTLDYSGEGALVRNAAATWSAPSTFSLAYLGVTSSPSSGNDRNEVWWASGGDNGVLAEARYWYWNGELHEADVTFNDDYAWGTGSASTNFDIQTVALHEIGHWLTLRDLYGAGDSNDVMFGWCQPGAQKRALSSDDTAGVRWIYDDLDVTPPVTVISGVPAGWTAQAATISLQATDDIGPVTTYYRIGAGNIQTYSSPFVVSTQGTNSIRYWSTDDEGNSEEARTASVLIDWTAPLTTVSGPATGYGEVEIAISASDPLSGVAHTFYTIDGGETREGAVVKLAEEGTHTIQAWSQDVAGNIETPDDALFTTTVKPMPGIELGRLSGSDRYATAVAVSQATFGPGAAETAVLATGADFADALSASGLAGAYNGPLLLTKRDSLPADVAGELERLSADRVVIVGGTSAVSEQVSLRLVALGYRVDRLSGSDRYRTAAAVARRITLVAGVPEDAFVARGDDFADALAAAPYAYRLKAPILLVKPTALPPATRDVLAELVRGGLTDVTIAGGPGAVNEDVAADVARLGTTVTRASGTSRYATAAALVRHAVARSWTAPSVVGITTGENFPDALGGGVAIGANGGAVLLTRSAYLRVEAEGVLRECVGEIDTIEVFGGESAVSPAVVDRIKELWELP